MDLITWLTPSTQPTLCCRCTTVAMTGCFLGSSQAFRASRRKKDIMRSGHCLEHAVTISDDGVDCGHHRLRLQYIVREHTLAACCGCSTAACVAHLARTDCCTGCRSTLALVGSGLRTEGGLPICDIDLLVAWRCRVWLEPVGCESRRRN